MTVNGPAGCDAAMIWVPIKPTPGPGTGQGGNPATQVNETRYRYSDLGQVTYSKDAEGRETSVVYSPGGQVIQTIAPDGTSQYRRYDGAQRPTVQVDPAGIETRAVYDPAGRVTETGTAPNIYSAVTQRVTQSYDKRGLVTGRFDTSGLQTIGVKYDPLGRPNEITEYGNLNGINDQAIISKIGYDLNGNATKLIDGRTGGAFTTNDANKTWWTQYNAWNLEIARIEPSATSTATEPVADRTFRTSYDAGGLVTSITTPGDTTGSTITINRLFNEIGNVVQETPVGTPALTAPVPTKTFTYDKLGRVKTASHPTAPLNFTWDDRNLLVATTGGAGTSSFQYDRTGALTKRTDGSSGIAQTRFDAFGRVAAETDSQSWVTRQYRYDAAGRVDQMNYQYLNGTATRSLSYTPLGQVDIDEQRDLTGNINYRVDHDYDTNGRLFQEQITPTTTGNGVTAVAGSGTHTYTYSRSGQLTNWTANSTSTNYAYDGAGNRTGAGTTTMTFDQRNRITNSGTNSYTWTPRGTMKTKTVAGVTTTMGFDPFARLTTSTTAITANNIAYTYDALDRIATRNTVKVFTYAGALMDPTSDGTSTIAQANNGGVLSIKTGVATRVAGSDRHGDITRLSDPINGQVTDTNAYDPYGVKTTSGTFTNPVGYQSDWTDPTSNDVWMGARFYSPSLAGFLNRDTYNGTLSSPVSLNRYTYAANNPMDYFDPTGHEPAALRKDAKIYGGPQTFSKTATYTPPSAPKSSPQPAKSPGTSNPPKMCSEACRNGTATKLATPKFCSESCKTGSGSCAFNNTCVKDKAAPASLAPKPGYLAGKPTTKTKDIAGAAYLYGAGETAAKVTDIAIAKMIQEDPEGFGLAVQQIAFDCAVHTSNECDEGFSMQGDESD
jgi:RHS repeat-associated protein